MDGLTDAELTKLKNSKSEQEWNDTCDEIQEAHGGYPEDWYIKVLASGVAAEAQLRWGH